MGNTKSYTVCVPLFKDEVPPTLAELQDWARTDYVICGVVGPRDAVNDRAFAVHSVSCSMNADELLNKLQARFPKRWMTITRFDADWSDFRNINIAEDGTVEIRIADNWHKPEEN